MKPKLTIELIPESAWGQNVRSTLSSEQWDAVKRFIFAKNNYKCEICGGQGEQWPVECHEVFNFNRRTRIQKLIRLESLCPTCHWAKHPGSATREGHQITAMSQLQKINNWSFLKTMQELDKAVVINIKRSQIQWKLDLTYLNQFGFKLEKPK